MPLAAYLVKDNDCCLLSVRRTVEMGTHVPMVHVSALFFTFIIAPTGIILLALRSPSGIRHSI
jgi:hypothetical protein